LVRKKDVLDYLSVEQPVKRKNVYGGTPYRPTSVTLGGESPQINLKL
jgi:hypothetical protein